VAEDCSIYNCLVQEDIPFTIEDGRTHIAKHYWDVRLSWNGLELLDVKRNFYLATAYNTKYDAEKYKYVLGSITPCGATSSGTITGQMSESVSGQVSQIMYADLEHDVYLVRKQTETHTSRVEQQNPFQVFTLYATVQLIAYFMQIDSTIDVDFTLYVKGQPVASFAKDTVKKINTAQPVVWPQPSSKSMFFLAAPGYEWLKASWFYWYNDPGDIGYAPCYEGFLTGDGVGIMNGYKRAETDGGKDFFYPDWIRDYMFVGCPPFHSLMAAEAYERFYNVLGGPVSKRCAAPFKTTLNANLWVTQDIIGNYIKYADHDFYSFFLPEVEQVINNLGNTEIKQLFDAAVAAAKDDDGLPLNLPSPEIYYPIGIA